MAHALSDEMKIIGLACMSLKVMTNSTVGYSSDS